MTQQTALIALIIALVTDGHTASAADNGATAKNQASHCKPIVVAIIDTGIDANHPKLKPYLWQNPGEHGLDKNHQNKANNQIDDDANGFIDDINGWNFAQHNNQLKDIHGHGSHVAGLVTGITQRHQAEAATTNQCHPLQLMVLKYYDVKLSAKETLEASTRAIRYATQNGANIINFSSGGFDRDEQEQNAINEAETHNILVVAAAGNNHDNNDHDGFYPASYKNQNILSIAALDRSSTQLVKSSNFGQRTVHIAAPGQDLVSTLPNNQMGSMTGTSQATAYTTGIVAQMLQHHPQMLDSQNPPQEIITHLITTATLDNAFRERTISGGKVNPSLALSLKGTDRDVFGYRSVNSVEMSTDANLLNLNVSGGRSRQAPTVNSAR